MTYAEMCRYIVAKEGYVWDEFLLVSKKRDGELARVRQICFYFAYTFFKNMSYRESAAIFGKDHATAIHGVSVIQSDIKTNVDLRRKIKDYQTRLAASIYNNWPSDNLESDALLEDVTEALEKMRLITEAYCKITGKRLV